MTDAPTPPEADDVEPAFHVLEGRTAFIDAAQELIAGARLSVDIQSVDLDREVYGRPAFVETVRDFLLANDRTQLRVLINDPKAAMRAGHRLIEFGRSLSSRVAFKEIPGDKKRSLVDDSVIGDGRALLMRARPDDLESRLYTQAADALRRQREFDAVWEHADPARELQGLRI